MMSKWEAGVSDWDIIEAVLATTAYIDAVSATATPATHHALEALTRLRTQHERERQALAAARLWWDAGFSDDTPRPWNSWNASQPDQSSLDTLLDYFDAHSYERQGAIEALLSILSSGEPTG